MATSQGQAIPQQVRDTYDEEGDTVSPLGGSPANRQSSINSIGSPGTAGQPRRISFHTSTSDDGRRELQQQQLDADDSADETTAIVRRLRGGRRNYDTHFKDSTINANGPQDTSNGPRPSSSQGDGTDDLDSSEEPLTGWRRILSKYGTVELENKGATARDHLALERTFLAWLRTSLAFASIGIAITQLFRLNTSIARDTPTEGQIRLRRVGKPLGATFIGIGIVTLLVGFHRYFESQHYVILGKFPASRGSIILVAFMSAALIIASFVVIITIAPKALEGSAS